MPIDPAAPFPLDPVRGQFDKFAELGRRLSALERGGTVQRGACEEDLAAIQFGQTIDWVEHTTPGLQITVPGRFGGRAVVGMHLGFEVKWVSGTAGTPPGRAPDTGLRRHQLRQPVPAGPGRSVRAALLLGDAGAAGGRPRAAVHPLDAGRVGRRGRVAKRADGGDPGGVLDGDCCRYLGARRRAGRGPAGLHAISGR